MTTSRRTDRFAPATLPARPNACRRYLKVRVRDTAYGVPATQVREIVYQPELSEAASAESNGNSLANLRGHVIPVLDAAVLVLGPDHWRADLAPECLVVLELGTGGGSQRVIGLLVDGVEEVVQVRDGGTNPAASPAPVHASREVSSLPCLEHLIRAHLGT